MATPTSLSGIVEFAGEIVEIPLPAMQDAHDHRGNIVSELKDNIRLFETVYIIRPNLDEEGVDKTIEAVEEFMKGQNCEILSTEKKGRKRLAYEVKKMRDGYYVHTVFKAGPEAIAQLKRMMSLSEDVIRELTIAVPKAALEAQA